MGHAYEYLLFCRCINPLIFVLIKKKNIEINDKKLNEETEKYHELEKSFLSLIKERETLKKDNETLITNHFEVSLYMTSN